MTCWPVNLRCHLNPLPGRTTVSLRPTPCCVVRMEAVVGWMDATSAAATLTIIGGKSTFYARKWALTSSEASPILRDPISDSSPESIF